MTADQILATVPTMQIDDRDAVAACVQLIDLARSKDRLREIWRHIDADSFSTTDKRAMRRLVGWRLQEIGRKRTLYGYDIPETV